MKHYLQVLLFTRKRAKYELSYTVKLSYKVYQGTLIWKHYFRVLLYLGIVCLL